MGSVQGMWGPCGQEPEVRTLRAVLGIKRGCDGQATGRGHSVPSPGGWHWAGVCPHVPVGAGAE